MCFTSRLRIDPYSPVSSCALVKHRAVLCCAMQKGKPNDQTLQRPTKRQGHRPRFPIIVEIAVPPGGLGKRLMPCTRFTISAAFRWRTSDIDTKTIAITCCGVSTAAQLRKNSRLNSVARWWDDQAGSRINPVRSLLLWWVSAKRRRFLRPPVLSSPIPKHFESLSQPTRIVPCA